MVSGRRMRRGVVTVGVVFGRMGRVVLTRFRRTNEAGNAMVDWI